MVSRAGEVICVARESGQIYWIRDLNTGFQSSKRSGMFGLGSRTIRPVWTGPLLASNRVIVAGSTGELVSLNAKTGEIERRVDLGAPTLLSPIAVGDTIYVVTDEAQLIALR